MTEAARPQTIGAVRIVTGQARGQTPITDFIVQYLDGTTWKDIEATKTLGNKTCDWHVQFAAVATPKVRLLVTRTPGDLIRIWELELYGPVKAAQ